MSTSLGLYPVYSGNKTGYINNQGEVVILFEEFYGHEFSEGFAHFEIQSDEGGSLYGFLNSEGVEIIPPQFEYAHPFSDGLAAVTTQEGEFFVRPDGSRLEMTFQHVHPFSEGLASVRIGGKWGVINVRGEIVITPRFEYPPDQYGFSEGLIFVRVPDADEKTKSGYVDAQGEWAIPPQFDQAWPFKSGVAAVLKEGKFGYINRAGEYVIEPQFDLAWPHFEGRAQVRIGGKHGYIDLSGTVVIPPTYNRSGGKFREGLAWICANGGWQTPRRGFINPEGEMVIVPKFEGARSFRNGVARVEVDSVPLQRRGDGVVEIMGEPVCYYINRAGEVIYKKPSFFTGF